MTATEGQTQKDRHLAMPAEVFLGSLLGRPWSSRCSRRSNITEMNLTDYCWVLTSKPRLDQPL